MHKAHTATAIAGFFFQFALRGQQRAFVLLAGQIADQACRHLDGELLYGDSVLLHEQHLIFRRYRDDDDRAAWIVAFGVFPATATSQAEPAALMEGFYVSVGVIRFAVRRIHRDRAWLEGRACVNASRWTCAALGAVFCVIQCAQPLACERAEAKLLA